ncbi:unnamed protein product [Callosobruchus maculatus]|uniref:Uncharacterized protein n=1 Tax=Callosobruchus maculatus TaxID=64391 RepID=A0A653BZV3_CALMS|nr:unnamed protein product [Callosobruchus maculatus]
MTEEQLIQDDAVVNDNLPKNIEMPQEITTIAYADDLALVVVARDENSLILKYYWAIEEVGCWPKQNGDISNMAKSKKLTKEDILEKKSIAERDTINV